MCDRERRFTSALGRRTRLAPLTTKPDGPASRDLSQLRPLVLASRSPTGTRRRARSPSGQVTHRGTLWWEFVTSTSNNSKPVRVGVQLQPQHADYKAIRRAASVSNEPSATINAGSVSISSGKDTNMTGTNVTTTGTGDTTINAGGNVNMAAAESTYGGVDLNVSMVQSNKIPGLSGGKVLPPTNAGVKGGGLPWRARAPSLSS